MQLFFYPDLNSDLITLPEDESKHCVRVLRKQVADTLDLIDGKGTHAIGEIVDANPKKCSLKIIQRVHHAQSKRSLHVAIAPTKNFDRMDWMLEKCTEIGVDEITFIETRNSERDKVNIERSEKILIQAIKQSKQYWLPRLNGITKLELFLAGQSAEALNLVAWCKANKTQQIGKKLLENANKPICLLIGPEGDFTTEEIAQARARKFEPVWLGNNILRTETAAVYACTIINHVLDAS
jgi:16S rRNA (uracil1498-N3)-methyltransferase